MFALRLTFTCELERRARRLTNAAAFAIAARVGRQVQQNVLPHERPQIDRLRTMKLGVQCERGNFDIVNELFQTSDARQFNRLFEGTIYPSEPSETPMSILYCIGPAQ